MRPTEADPKRVVRLPSGSCIGSAAQMRELDLGGMTVGHTTTMGSHPAPVTGPNCPQACARSCYRCLQRYNNRGYHGLLDWRLGLGFLRAMVDPSWTSGLDGDWAASPSTSDWPSLAAQAADDIRRLDPENRRVESVGPLNLPAVLLTSGPALMAYVLVHPFWRLDDEARRSGPLADTRADLGDRDVCFLDTFEVARRPVKALENARNRPADRY
jgi:hypothetical protein